jgi:CBS-domain-containing membrane protein
VRVLHERRISAVAVVDGDGRLLGIVSETDLALKEDRPPGWAQPHTSLAVSTIRRSLATSSS